MMEEIELKTYEKIDEKDYLAKSMTFNKKNLTQEDIEFEMTIKPLIKDIDDFTRCDRFDRMLILNKESDFYVCGRLFSRTSEKKDKIERIHLSIDLSHKYLPLLFGFDISNDGQDVYEIRKIGFEPLPLTKQLLSEMKRRQTFKIISQIIEFVNCIIMSHHTVMILTLEDIFSCCFLDSNFNIFFGNLTFVDSEYDFHKSINSLGMIVYQLLGFELVIEEGKIIKNLEFNSDISYFWIQFISSCFDKIIDVQSFYSTFIRDVKDKSWILDEIKDNELENEEISVDTCQEERKDKTFEKINYSLKELINKYQDKRYNIEDAHKNEKFTRLDA